jgi:hypothetical protein
MRGAGGVFWDCRGLGLEGFLDSVCWVRGKARRSCSLRSRRSGQRTGFPLFYRTACRFMCCKPLASLHRVVVVRLRWHEQTKAYAARRMEEGRSKPEIMRRLKRFIAREVFHTLLGRPPVRTAAT